MKRNILLFLCMLCLSGLLPLASYRLVHGSFTAAGATGLGTEIGTNSSTQSANNTSSGNANSTGIDSSIAPLSTPSPTLALPPESKPSPTPSPSTASSSSSSGQTQSEASSDSTPTPEAPFLIYDEGSGEVLEISVREYLIGAVASELAMTWPEEALKAQAIACHSYLLYNKAHADPNHLGGAYLSADPARRQGFMTDTVLHSYWGTAYTQNYAQLSALIDEVLDVVVLYDGAPAATSYFAISNSTTEASEAVWGTALPYLISVSSSADASADGYLANVTYTEAQVKDILRAQFGIDVSGSGYAAAKVFGEAEHTDAGYVATMDVCGVPLSGSQLRAAFSLRSSCFTVTHQPDGSYLFTTAGYGHGVGLSQWGAKFMAEGGSNYQEILAHYFPNTTFGSALAL